MERRNPLACDQCHLHKLKCKALAQGCACCPRMIPPYDLQRDTEGSILISGTGLNIGCTSEKLKSKRGRKPAVLGSATVPSVASCLTCRLNQVPANRYYEN
jgi:hypothetical protein